MNGKKHPTSAAINTPLDAAWFAEQTGVVQFGGWVTVGLKTKLSAIADSSVIRSRAMCLAEACELSPDPFATLGSVLAWGPSYVSLAVMALQCQIGVVASKTGGRAGEPIWSEFTTLSEPPENAQLFALRFHAAGTMSGSALAPAAMPPTMASSVQAVAVALSFEPVAREITEAFIALLPDAGAPVRAVTAEAYLRGQTPDAHVIAVAAQRALAEFVALRRPAFDTGAYPIHLAAHLVRQALDRAAARALAQSIGL